MHWHSSHFFCCFLYLLTLDRVYVTAEVICEPGEKVTKNRCEPCPPNQYNAKKGSNKECRNCEPCGLYTTEVLHCTPKSNTKCRCNDGFIPYDESRKNCKCPNGSGLTNLENGKTMCRICPPNSPTNQVNTPCLPQYLEKIPGNTTCDVNCGNKAKTVVAPSPLLPHSQTSASTSTPTPTSSSNVSATTSSPTTSIPERDDSRKHALWLAPLAALLLLILILKLSRCPREKTEIVRQGSACGKPVEESGNITTVIKFSLNGKLTKHLANAGLNKWHINDKT